MLSDKIVALRLPSPFCISGGTSVRQVIETVQSHRDTCIIVCEGKRVVGTMTEREVLMKVVARDVSYDEPVDRFMTPNPPTLTLNHTILEAISLMDREGSCTIPIVDAETGEAIALLRIRDIIDELAESFPAQVINLPPRPHQHMKTPEGA